VLITISLTPLDLVKSVTLPVSPVLVLPNMPVLPVTQTLNSLMELVQVNVFHYKFKDMVPNQIPSVLKDSF